MRVLIQALALGILLSGCGRDEPPPTAPPPTPTGPLAVKDVYFGVSVKEVEARFRPLQKVADESGLSVYSHQAKGSVPILSYAFEFIDGKLVACQVFYDGPLFDQNVKRDDFFRTIEVKYGVKSDFGTSGDLRRWLSVETKTTITWQEDFKRKVNTLTVSWDEMDEVRKARRAAIERARKREAEPPPPPPKKVDIGI